MSTWLPVQLMAFSNLSLMSLAGATGLTWATTRSGARERVPRTCHSSTSRLRHRGRGRILAVRGEDEASAGGSSYGRRSRYCYGVKVGSSGRSQSGAWSRSSRWSSSWSALSAPSQTRDSGVQAGRVKARRPANCTRRLPPVERWNWPSKMPVFASSPSKS